ncbi:hypothetical protein HU668_21300 [Pantoea brenneri]|jgi:hypothetical protein|uniref:Uncharacterized protein n=1 Tax=Pantoea brenneri TaxID=472694 RepID=A0A653XK13_9GAMM|nr:hypothetical protein [Pantoea brenneri]NUY61902.1 hypothetical protein [Pantoea brenneri]NUY98980.1 hypothetical protein [Pantoea brenneri]NYB13642.1 hypothetical protein [Pantoea brenneri]VXC30440.1 hypothetical protein PANT111_300002 [Pantoea brenneri]
MSEFIVARYFSFFISRYYPAPGYLFFRRIALFFRQAKRKFPRLKNIPLRLKALRTSGC